MTTMFEPIKRAPAYKVVERDIRDKVLAGELAQGSMLPSETEIAEQIGVTRATVREAFRSLESSGLIVRGPGRRMIVSAPSSEIVTKAMQNSIVLRGVSYRELWEVNTALEPAAAELAADNATDDVIAALEENLRWTSRVLAAPDELARADVEFHELVAEASANRALLIAREPLGQLLLPAYSNVIRKIGPGQRLFEAHTQVFEAIRDQDRDTARTWMTRHIADFRRGCELAGLDLDDPVAPISSDVTAPPSTAPPATPPSTKSLPPEGNDQ